MSNFEKHQSLILNLCESLNQSGVRYCHWKSNANIQKSLNGEGDLDLLIHHQDVQLFNQILFGLGFKEAESPIHRRIPGIRDYYGYDPDLEEFVHVHAHFQLVVGHDATKDIHLLIETEYINTATLSGPIKLPAVEFEYIVFVLRMVLKHLTWGAYLRLESRLKKNENLELEWLRTRITPEKVEDILFKNFSNINKVDFYECANRLAEKSTGLGLLPISQRLVNRLRDWSRMSRFESDRRQFTYRVSEAFSHRILKRRNGKKFASGGLFIAVIGGDGAGKSTLIASISPWLKQVFDTMQIHLGKPEWSFWTKVVRGILRIFRRGGKKGFLQAPLVYTNEPEKIKFPGIPWAIREVCTARDRYMTYRKAYKYSSNGGIVISDRFPFPGINFMDGPQIKRMVTNEQSNWLIRWMIRKEESYYIKIRRPDLTIVLKLDPDISIQRKTEEKKEDVWARGNEIWTFDWTHTNVHIIDASKPKEDVLKQVRSLVWSYF